MLPCLAIFCRNFILIWKCQKWSLNRGTLVSATAIFQTKCPITVLRALFWFFRMLPYDSRFIPGNRWLWVFLDGKSSQEYPVNTGVPQGSILGPSFFLLCINDLPDDVICNIAVNTYNTTLYSKCDLMSDLWPQLELVSELESDLQDTVDWDRKWLGDFNAGKPNSFNLTCETLVPLMWKWMVLFLELKSSFQMLG